MAKATATKVTVTKTVEVEEDVVTLELSPEEAQALRTFLGCFSLKGPLSDLDNVWREVANHTMFSNSLTSAMCQEVEDQFRL